MNTATITVAEDGTATIDLDGQPPHQLHADDLPQVRQQAVAVVIDHARQTGQPVRLLARDDTAEHLLDVHPDGTVQPAPQAAENTPASPTAGSSAAGASPRSRRRWSLVAGAVLTAGVAGLAVIAMRSTTPPATPAAEPAPQTPAAVEDDSAAEDAPTRLYLAGTRTRMPWPAAANWQSKADAARQAQRQPVTAPYPTAPVQQHQTSVIPAAPQYHQPVVNPPRPPQPKQPPNQGSVKVFPDPEIDPN